MVKRGGRESWARVLESPGNGRINKRKEKRERMEEKEEGEEEEEEKEKERMRKERERDTPFHPEQKRLFRTHAPFAL